MGRSVMTPSGDNTVICYKNISDYDEFDWELFVENIQQTMMSTWKSFYEADKYLEREIHAILENGLTYVVVSEYCGLASISLVSKYEYDGWDEDIKGLADNFIRQITPKFEKYFGEYRKLGNFNNGEGLYEKIA